jgi:hypothetical protein
MTVLNPANKATSLRVDADGRLLVSGGVGGGGLTEAEVNDLIAAFQPARSVFVSGHAINDTDNGTIIETGSTLVFDVGLTPNFECVVLVENAGSVSIESNGGIKLNGVANTTVTRAFADNKMFTIIQRSDDPTDFLISGI